jgi:hypothetical protein
VITFFEKIIKKKPLKKNIKLLFYYKNFLKFFKIFYLFIQKNLYLSLLYISDIIKNVRTWHQKTYKKEMHTLFYTLYLIENKFKEYCNIFLIALINSKIKKTFIQNKRSSKNLMINKNDLGFDELVFEIDFFNNYKSHEKIYLH